MTQTPTSIFTIDGLSSSGRGEPIVKNARLPLGSPDMYINI